MTIGGLAAAADVGVETVRYYQRRGLIPEPPRPPGGQRRYPETAITRLRFIRRAQALGFTLKEVAVLMSLDGGVRACAPTRALAAHKRAELERKIADLGALRAVLTDLIDQCDSRRGKARCPIIATLVRGGRSARHPASGAHRHRADATRTPGADATE